jgi:hypothetical protein
LYKLVKEGWSKDAKKKSLQSEKIGMGVARLELAKTEVDGFTVIPNPIFLNSNQYLSI